MSEHTNEPVPEEVHTKEKQPYYFANRPIEFGGTTPEAIQQDIDTARAEGYRIPREPDLAVAKTLATFELKPYGSQIPPAAKYISARIKHSDDGFPGFNYGNFVETPRQIAFAKLRYGPKNMEKKLIDNELVDVRVGGLARENAILTALGENGYETPAVLGYSPAYPENAEPDEAETLETLYIEAIPPEEGTTLPPEHWTPDLAMIAARKIKTFDKPAEEIELFANEEIQLPVEVLVRRARLADDDEYHAALAETLTTYQHLDQPIVVHGDTWLNNIIVKHDGSDAMFIDWELAGAGYKGQDAGRTLWGLTLDGNWNFAEVSEAAEAFTREWCETEDDATNLKYGILLESLRWIADRSDKLANESLDEKTALDLMQQIDDVKQHTLKILGSIQ